MNPMKMLESEHKKCTLAGSAGCSRFVQGYYNRLLTEPSLLNSGQS